MHLFAVRAGLVGDQRRAEQAFGLALHVVDRFHHLDAAGLAAAAGMDLRLHDPDRSAEVVGGFDSLIHAHGRDAARHRHAEFAQHRLGLVFVDVHGEAPRPLKPKSVIPRCERSSLRMTVIYAPRFGAIFLQASTKPSTDCTDFSNMPRSAPLSSISTTRSTPLPPMTTGTPT